LGGGGGDRAGSEGNRFAQSAVRKKRKKAFAAGTENCSGKTGSTLKKKKRGAAHGGKKQDLPTSKIPKRSRMAEGAKGGSFASGRTPTWEGGF